MTWLSSATALTCNSTKAHVVLVHGILGWSSSEAGGVPHFQHAHILEATGCFTVHTPKLAILGSNHDRAAQLHAQLVGGVADHGIAHSSNPSTQHKRYGSENYTTPMISDFLEPGGLPVYFLAHSLGAPTVRQYEILLRDGSDAEKAATPAGNLSSLYEGGHDGLIAGFISLNGALDGTVLIDALGDDVIELAKKVVWITEALTGDISADLGLYDYGFGYLGARCSDSGEYSINECLEDTLALPGYNNSDWNDHAGVANLAGAAELNRQGDVTSNTTIYLAYVGDATRPYYGVTYAPQSYMSSLLKPLAYLIGFYKYDDRRYDGWRQSDGVISVPGQECPRLALDTYDHCAMFTTVEDMQPGVWYRTYHTLDHIAVIGWTFNETQIEIGAKIWTDIGYIIQGMEARHNRTFVSEDTFN